MTQRFANYAATTLASGIASGDVSLTVASAASFPTLSGSDYFYAVLTDSTDTNHEVVKVTATSGATWTITRAQDGTTAQAWGPGSRVEMRLVAANLNDIWVGDGRFAGVLGSHVYTVATLPSGSDGDQAAASDALIPYGVQKAGDGTTVSFSFSTPVPGSVLTRTDWQGTQLLYATARTNLCPGSGTIGGSQWGLLNGCTMATAVAPDGGSTASLLTAGSSVISYAQSAIMTISASSAIPWCLFVKAGTSTQTRISFYDSGVNTSIQNNFITWAGGVPSGAGMTFTPLAGGWYRIDGSFNSGAYTACRMLVYPDMAAGTGNMTAYGAQVGTSGSYIPTTTAAVTVTDYTTTPQGKVTFATTTTSVSNEPMANGDNSTVTFPLLVNGAPLPNAASPVVAPLYRTDWQGTQIMYPTARTNLLVWSSDQTNSNWQKNNVTVSGGVSDPFGGTSAATVTATANSGYIFQNVPVSNVVYTNSIWIRRRTGTGNVTLSNPGQVPVVCAVTNSWQRFSASSLPIGGSILQIGVQLAVLGDAVDIAFAQAELGSTATSYIPTTTAAVTVTDYTLAYNSGSGRWEVTYATAPVSGATQMWSGTIQGGPANGSLLTWNTKGGTVFYLNSAWRTYNGMTATAGV